LDLTTEDTENTEVEDEFFHGVDSYFIQMYL
jgi:hypothetical protein